MNPPYQRRGRLWSDSDKAYLIDSIINGFDVPKLYMADFQSGDNPLNKKRLPYAIIDGKQRLEAVFDFFDGTLVLNEDFVWRADPSLSLGGLSLKDLQARYPSVADDFETETLDIMSVSTRSEEDINELFVRLNRSKPLTGAEIRNAMLGPVTAVIRNVGSHAFFKENIKFSVLRAGDLNAASKIVLFEYEERPVGTKKNDLDRFAKLKKTLDKAKLELAGRRALDTLDDLQEVFLPRDQLLSSAGTLPVYYWLVRQASFQAQQFIREFLVEFERIRKLSRERRGSEAISVKDTPYARYDAFNRNANDIGSHVGRFEILRDELLKWTAANTKVNPKSVFREKR